MNDQTMRYLSAMAQARAMRRQGLIDGAEYSQIDQMMLQKYSLALSSLYRDKYLLTAEVRGTMSHCKGGDNVPKLVNKIEATSRLAQLKRVATYARVSSGKDAMLHSLSAQVSHYSQKIQAHKGWQYIGVYTDEAATGTKEDRSGFQRLLADCRAGHIDMIMTKSISRFARNTVTLLETVRELKTLGVDVFFEEQNLHSTSADGELMLTILASYAQEESRSVSENCKWRIRKGFERGELMCLQFMLGLSY